MLVVETANGMYNSVLVEGPVTMRPLGDETETAMLAMSSRYLGAAAGKRYHTRLPGQAGHERLPRRAWRHGDRRHHRTGALAHGDPPMRTSPAGFDLDMTDRLLTTTRAVRKRLDLDGDVSDATILECIDLAEQAPSGGNDASRRWLVIRDQDLKDELGRLYADVGAGFVTARERMPDTHPKAKVISSGAHLVENFAKSPVLVMCAIWGIHDNSGKPGLFDSGIQAAWSFNLALRARGLGTVYLHHAPPRRTRSPRSSGSRTASRRSCASPSPTPRVTTSTPSPGVRRRRSPTSTSGASPGNDRAPTEPSQSPTDPAWSPRSTSPPDPPRSGPSSPTSTCRGVLQRVPRRRMDQRRPARHRVHVPRPQRDTRHLRVGGRLHRHRGHEPHAVEWRITDADDPGAIWRFEVAEQGNGSRLRMSMVIGERNNGTAPAARKAGRQDPLNEQKVLNSRREALKANMQRTIEGVKAIAEGHPR